MEIERKFLVKKLPDLSHIEPSHYERYYLYIDDRVEERIQKVDGYYTYEKKTFVDNLTRSTDRKVITVEEFEGLKVGSSRAILRDSYKLSENLSIKIYHGEYEGLIRAEIEFASRADADSYVPDEWMGKEITATPLGKDSSLLELSASAMAVLLSKTKIAHRN